MFSHFQMINASHGIILSLEAVKTFTVSSRVCLGEDEDVATKKCLSSGCLFVVRSHGGVSVWLQLPFAPRNARLHSAPDEHVVVFVCQKSNSDLSQIQWKWEFRVSFLKNGPPRSLEVSPR